MRYLRALAVAVVMMTIAAVAVTSASAQVERWGSYIGGGERFTESFPTPFAGTEEGVEQVQASNSNTIVLKEGSVYVSGDAHGGELGNGSEADTQALVKATFPADVRIVSVGESKNDGFAIDSTGQGWSWGSNASGDLCLGKSGKVLLPTKVPGMTAAAQVVGGGQHVIWLLKSGKVETCGLNKNGQLGVGLGVTSSRVTLEIPGLAGIVEVSSGSDFSGARNAAGEVWLFGDDTQGQVCNGKEEAAVYAPFKVPFPGSASQISLGGDVGNNGQSLALIGGEVVGCGADGSMQIGDGSKVDKRNPIQTGLHYTVVIASGNTSFGLTEGGELEGWGANTGGVMGVSTKKPSAKPVPVLAGVTKASSTAENTVSD